jgi:hypothetical protein
MSDDTHYINFSLFADNRMMNAKIYEFLRSEGIPPNIIGFHYLMRGIELLCTEARWIFGGPDGIYTRICQTEHKKFNWKAIERMCRHAKSKAKRHTEMTMKEWFCWAAIECRCLLCKHRIITDND